MTVKFYQCPSEDLSLPPSLSRVLILIGSCTLVTETLKTGGERQFKPVPPPPPPAATHVLIFAMDGAAPAQFMEAVHSGHAPNIAALLGKEQGNGVFEHAYAAPHALSVLPSSTIADWAAIFTGSVPAYDGVPGDEWFERETMQFYAPVPVSVPDTADNAKVVTDDLVGRQLKVPTLFEDMAIASSYRLAVIDSSRRDDLHHGGARCISRSDRASDQGRIEGQRPGEIGERARSIATRPKKFWTLSRSMGFPNLQVVYLPGIDIFTHGARDRLVGQTRYLEHVTDGCVGRVLDAYRDAGVMDHTYVIFISDHAHIPTLDNERQRARHRRRAFAVRGGSSRPASGCAAPRSSFPISIDDYQAVLAYQGFMAYIYLADRSTCRHEHHRCNWKKPARFEEDVIPVLKTLYRSNQDRASGREAEGQPRFDFRAPRRAVGRERAALHGLRWP